LKQVKYSTNYR